MVGDCAWFVRAGGRIAVIWSSSSCLLREAHERGLSPQSDTDLLPVLLELLAGLIPVTGWPTQMSKSRRTGHARQVTQAHLRATGR